MPRLIKQISAHGCQGSAARSLVVVPFGQPAVGGGRPSLPLGGLRSSIRAVIVAFRKRNYNICLFHERSLHSVRLCLVSFVDSALAAVPPAQDYCVSAVPRQLSPDASPLRRHPGLR